MSSWKGLLRFVMAALSRKLAQVTRQPGYSEDNQVMTATYKEAPRYSFPSGLDMLAEFGLDENFDEDTLSSTYVFHGPADETELIVTYSEQMRFVAVTLLLKGAELFTVDTDNVVSLRIVRERGACWLQVAFEAERKHSDMYIHLEPTLKLQW